MLIKPQIGKLFPGYALTILLTVTRLAQASKSSVWGRGVMVINREEREESFNEIKTKYKHLPCGSNIQIQNLTELYYISSHNFGDPNGEYGPGQNCSYTIKGTKDCIPAFKCDNVDLRKLDGEFLEINDAEGGELHLAGASHIHNYTQAGSVDGFKIKFKSAASKKFKRHYDGYFCQLRCYPPCPDVMGVDKHCLTSKYGIEPYCTNPIPTTYVCEEAEHEILLNLDGNGNCSEIPEVNVPIHANQTLRIKFQLSVSSRKPSLDFFWLGEASGIQLSLYRNASSDLLSMVKDFSDDFQFGFATYATRETDRIFDVPPTCANGEWTNKYTWSRGKRNRDLYKDNTLKYAPFLYPNGRIVGGFSYRNNLPLTSDASTLSKLPEIVFNATKLHASMSRTWREDLLMALNQAVVCKEVKFRPKSRKIIFMTTDQYGYYNKTNSEIQIATWRGQKIPEKIIPLDYSRCYLGVNQQNNSEYVSLPDYQLPDEHKVHANVKTLNAQIVLAVRWDDQYTCFSHIQDLLPQLQGFIQLFNPVVVQIEERNLTSTFGAVEAALTKLKTTDSVKLIFHPESPISRLLTFGNGDGDYTGEKFVQCKKLEKTRNQSPLYQCELAISMVECAGGARSQVSYTVRTDGQPDLAQINFHLFC